MAMIDYFDSIRETAPKYLSFDRVGPRALDAKLMPSDLLRRSNRSETSCLKTKAEVYSISIKAMKFGRRPPSSNSCSSSLVQRDSVHSQFATLSKERDGFRNDISTAEQEYNRIANELDKLKRIQASRMRESVTAQEELGNLTRTLALSKQELSRLKRVFEQERKELEDCTRLTKVQSEKDRKRKEKYIEDMEVLNDKMEIMLDSEERVGFQSLLSLKAVAAVARRDPHFQTQVSQSKNFIDAMCILKETEDKAELEGERYIGRRKKLGHLRAQAENANISGGLESRETTWGSHDVTPMEYAIVQDLETE